MRALILVLATLFEIAAFAAHSPNREAKKLSERLAAICAKTTNYHFLVRDVAHEVRSDTLNHPWSEVRRLIQREGFKESWHRENEVDVYRFSAGTNSWFAGDRSRHPLYLQFTVDTRKKNQSNTREPGLVIVARAGLVAQPNIPYTQALTNNTYENDSAIMLALKTARTSEAARKYPYVKRVEVEYDYIRDRWSEFVPRGFYVHITLGNSPTSEKSGSSLSFSLKSGLDPDEDWNGNRARGQSNFKARDTLGEPQYWGGSEWK